MEDSRIIENLIYLYAERIDAGDLEGVAELFRNGEIASPAHNACQTGYEEVLAMYRQSCRLYEDSGTPKTRHITTNAIIEVSADGQSATARSSYMVVQATETLPLQPIICGRYHDSFRKVSGIWEFARREMFVDLLGDLSAHLLYDAQNL